MTQILTTRDEVRSVLSGLSQRPGLAPTMGALHAGHEALIARSARENPWTVVSIFVNPTQFQDPSDLERYPRDLDRDAEIATAAGADLIFAPTLTEMYPPGSSTRIDVGPLANRWEGVSRPGHFAGVATVVAILLNLVRPVRAYFGEKDYQQLQVVKRMHLDLALPGEIIGCATIREADGLALSSRNSRLSSAARRQAAVIPRALTTMTGLAEAGETDAATLLQAGREVLATVPEFETDYLAVVDGTTLEPVDSVTPGTRVLLAGVLDGVRLIDNKALAPGSTARADSGEDADAARG
jgi:pantoate--beta-alanine ligase